MSEKREEYIILKKEATWRSDHINSYGSESDIGLLSHRCRSAGVQWPPVASSHLADLFPVVLCRPNTHALCNMMGHSYISRSACGLPLF